MATEFESRLQQFDAEHGHKKPAAKKSPSPKPKVLAKWIEVSQTILEDGPPKRRDYEIVVFRNDCELRETAKRKYVLRKTGCDFLNGRTQENAREKLRQLLLHDDVRMLAEGVDANDFDTLPHEETATKALIEGTADIYVDKYKMGLTRSPTP